MKKNKKLLAITILSLCFITSSLANDIKDFQLKGIDISVGDNLLDHHKKFKATRDELSKIPTGKYPKSDKFVLTKNITSIKSDYYDSLSFEIDPKSFEIRAIKGKKDIENIDSCIKLQAELFSSYKEEHPPDKENIGVLKSHPIDTSGKSLSKTNKLNYANGDVVIICTKWNHENEKVKNEINGLMISILTKEHSLWLKNEAY